MLTGYDPSHTPDISERLEKYVEQVLGMIQRRRGKNDAAKSATIENTTGLKGSEVRAVVHFLRTMEFEIASGGSGYWFAQSATDLDDTIAHLIERRNSIQYVLDGLERRRETMRT